MGIPRRAWVSLYAILAILASAVWVQEMESMTRDHRLKVAVANEMPSAGSFIKCQGSRTNDSKLDSGPNKWVHTNDSKPLDVNVGVSTNSQLKIEMETVLPLLVRALHAAGITRWFITHGTLLGWYRECAFLMEHDIDIGIFEEEMTREHYMRLHTELLRLGLQKHMHMDQVFKWSSDGPPLFSPRLTQVLYSNVDRGENRKLEYLDIWTVHTMPNYLWTAQGRGETILPCWNHFTWNHFDICHGELAGTKVQVPCNIESQLEEHHGSSWRTPVHNEDQSATDRFKNYKTYPHWLLLPHARQFISCFLFALGFLPLVLWRGACKFR